MLATEHWSLLASRSTTQGEVLTRIAIFITLVSAGLLSLGVLGNVTGFRGWFGVAALGVLFLLVPRADHPRAGVQHGDRGPHVRHCDEPAEGRLRRSRPGNRDVLPASANDDVVGAQQTYYSFDPRGSRHLVFGSSMMIIAVVTAAVAGLSSVALRSRPSRPDLAGGRARHRRRSIGASSGGCAGGYRGTCWRRGAPHVPLRAQPERPTT